MRIVKAFIIWSIVMLSYKAFSMEEGTRGAATPLLQQPSGRGMMHQPNPTWYTTVATCYRWCLPAWQSCWPFRAQHHITDKQNTEAETQTTPRAVDLGTEESCCQGIKRCLCCNKIQ